MEVSNSSALEMLMSDHRKVEAIFEQFKMGGDSAQFRQLFTQLYQELSLHAEIEENIFYPALARYPEFAHLLKDSYKDHAKVKAELGQLTFLPNTSDTWSKKMTDLQQDVMEHVQQEENTLFPKVRQVMGVEALQQLGQELEQGKKVLMEGVKNSLPMKELNKTNSEAGTMHGQATFESNLPGTITGDASGDML